MPTDDPDDLRRRARELRVLATRLETTPALTLDEHAGPDTWRTPRAELCRSLLAASRAQVRRAADELRWRAHRLDERALETEARRAAVAALVGGAP